jgi:hypothetical protein
MIRCRLIDAHGVSLWFGMSAQCLPSEIRRPTGRTVPPSDEDVEFCKQMGIAAEPLPEYRVFRLFAANAEIAEFREVAA